MSDLGSSISSVAVRARRTGRSAGGGSRSRTAVSRAKTGWGPRRGVAELWLAALDEQPADVVKYLQTFVSADEVARASRFYFERDRRRFIVGRAILRILLARYVGRSPRQIAFAYGPNGKPALASPDAPAGTDASIYFNVTHSDGLVVYAFAGEGEIGVDVERIRDVPEWDHIALSYFAPAELARLYARPVGERPVEFFRSWTRQEALWKALGVGLGGAVGRGVVAPRRLESVESPSRTELRFNVQSLDVASGFAAAVAVPRTLRHAMIRRWHPAMTMDDFAPIRGGIRVPLPPGQDEAAT
jgi:4'-phosphopantetheinyl transferase